MTPLVIAEAGVNHNGDLAEALRLVEAAAAAGADIVKFQTFRAERLVGRDTPTAVYQQAHGAGDRQFDMLRRLELTPEMHQHLFARCADLGIEFLSTGFDEDCLDQLAALGVRRFKVPSGELTNLPWLRHLARLATRLPVAAPAGVIMSTGMATRDEVVSALEVLLAGGVPRAAITVLQCTTAYPTPAGEANLLAMHTLGEVCGTAVGFSDHTDGIHVAVAAAALGATVIEKHLTMNRLAEGPDHAASLEPDQFAELVRGVRDAAAARGSAMKQPAPSERPNMAAARKSIAARVAIPVGAVLTEAMLTTRRPGDGVSPMLWDQVIGRTTRRAYQAGDLIEW